MRFEPGDIVRDNGTGRVCIVDSVSGGSIKASPLSAASWENAETFTPLRPCAEEGPFEFSIELSAHITDGEIFQRHCGIRRSSVDDALFIGCAEFFLATLTSALRCLVRFNATARTVPYRIGRRYDVTEAQLKPTRDGIVIYDVDTRYCISYFSATWAEAERLLEYLETL